MASVYKRGKIRWIKFYPPGKSEPTRQSLGAVDPAWAELIRRKLELELHLRTPELRQVKLPGNVLETLGDPPAAPPPQIPPPLPFPAEPAFVPEAPVARTSPPVREVLGEYLAHIEVENSSHHVKNKISYLKKFFGSELLGAKEPCKGVFLGETLEDVRAGDVRRLIDSLPVGKKTKRHHRNAFHSFFEHAMKCGFYEPSNFRYPNPMSALPSYYENNKKIVFLTQPQIDAVLEVLKPSPAVRMAAAIMIYAGLRRAETLWLTKSNVAGNLKFLSVVNKTDEEKDLESSLKTGERSVPILPPLKALPRIAKI